MEEVLYWVELMEAGSSDSSEEVLSCGWFTAHDNFIQRNSYVTLPTFERRTDSYVTQYVMIEYVVFVECES